MPQDFMGEIRVCRGRKPYRCEWCGEHIEKGETHQHVSTRYDGDFQCYRMHLECADAQAEENEVFMPYENYRPEAGPLVLLRLA